MHQLKLFLFCALMLLSTMATADSQYTCPEVKLQLERLPDLNIPRAGHQLFFVNGEPTVAGGHTNGFVPTQTAEYYKDGEWHQLPMVYCHDNGGSVVLSSGQVLLFGGSSEPIGIGQTYLAELYDPSSHTFDGFGSMERKRTMAAALELDSGRVVIAGNWYHDDGIEMFDGQKRFTYIKDVTEHRAQPYILRIASDDALFVGFSSNRGDVLRSAIADRLKGDTMHIPLLETWHPLSVWHHADADAFIGDEQIGQYSYLMPVVDDSGQIAIARVDNGTFSQLPTAGRIPMSSQGDSIFYSSNIVVDRQAGRAYMTGADSAYRTAPDKAHRLYILCIDYVQAAEGKPAPLTLYYTDPIDFVPDCSPVLTPEGNLLIAGGLKSVSNFTPSASVRLLRIGRQDGATAGSPRYRLWTFVALVVLLLAVPVFLLVRSRRDITIWGQPTFPVPAMEPVEPAPAPEPEEGDTLLMQHIRRLMEQEQLFTNVNLKVRDVAVRLGTNNRYVSNCIRQCEGTTFSGFVNGYRIRYAQQLMRTSSGKKVSSLYLEAGFANESTFFRTFKAFTGMTPKEWMEKDHHQ